MALPRSSLSLLACVAFFLAQTAAQTIVVDGTTVAADTTVVNPAVEAVPGSSNLTFDQLQLTDAVISNLTSLQLSNISLFDFASTSNASSVKRSTSASCKTAPGDLLWPIPLVWNVFDLLLGGSLIKAVPVASPCYDNFGNYDAERCAYVADQWTSSSLHEEDPTSVMSPLYQGLTCLPDGWGPFGNCTMGGYPSYVVNVTNVAQIQLAVNLARNLNLRLVVKNTGHDFKGRSAGADALSIWTHYLKGLEFIPSITTPSYSGAAIKGGAGIQGSELYEFADANNVTALAGEGRTVGVFGGYIAGGGHSPLSSLYGMAADQILSVDIVTPDGRFITASEEENTELFWGLCGGGASTFGVVTSYTVKAHPRIDPITISTFAIASSDTISTDTFWAAIEAYWKLIPTFVDAGTYGYWYFFNMGGVLSLTMDGWVAPYMTLDEFNNLTAPLFDTWSALGIEANPVTTQHDSFLSAFNEGFPLEAAGTNVSRSASRLIPRENVEDDALWNTTFAALKTAVELSSGIVGVATTGKPTVGDFTAPDNAVNDAWRGAVMQVLPAYFWASNATMEEASDAILYFNETVMGPVREVTPGSGAYDSEGNVLEPNWQESFYGADKYARLSALKKEYDPWSLFYALHGVGSEDWYVTGQLPGLPTQNGRLCRLA